MGWIWQGLRESKRDVAVMEKGDAVLFVDSDGYIRRGSVRIKEVRCGKKNCSKCPHRIYAYARYRVGEKVTEKYLGVVK